MADFTPDELEAIEIEAQAQAQAQRILAQRQQVELPGYGNLARYVPGSSVLSRVQQGGPLDQILSGIVEAGPHIGAGIADIGQLIDPTFYFDSERKFGDYTRGVNKFLREDVGLTTNVEPEGYTALAKAIAEGVTGGGLTTGVGALPGVSTAFPTLSKALSAHPILEVVSGATGAAGAEGAKQAGAGPVGQLAAGVVGGGLPFIATSGGRLVKSLVDYVKRPGKPEIQRELAREVIEKFSGQPRGNLISAIEQGEASAPKALLPTRTTDELADSSRLALLRNSLEKKMPELTDVDARVIERAQTRSGLLEALQPGTESVPREQVGKSAFDILAEGKGQLTDKMRALYASVSDDNIPINTAVENIVAKQKEFQKYGGSTAKIDSGVQALINDLREAKAKGPVPIGLIQRIQTAARTRASTLTSSDTATASQKMSAGIANTIADELENSLDAAVPLGTTDEALSRLRAARETRKTIGESFERGLTGDILKTKRFGEKALDAAEVTDSILSATPDEAERLLGAIKLSPRGKEALPMVRRALVDRIIEKSSPPGGRTITNASFNKNLALYDGALKKVMAPFQRRVMKEVADDLFSEANIAVRGRRASSGQSITAQEALSQLFLKKNIAFDTAMRGRPILKSIGDLIGRTIGPDKEDAIYEVNRLILQATSDPKFAKILLKESTPENMKIAFDFLKTYSIAGGTSGAAGALSTGLEE